MTVTVPSRLAGKALLDFFKLAGGVAGSAAEQAAFNYLTKAGNYADAPGILGRIASLPPGATSKLVGAATPLALSGAAMGIGSLLSTRQQSNYALPVQRPAAAQRQPAFATQQYIPGTHALTNEQMGEALLDQQRFQHQLELISARQSAANRMGSIGGGNAGIQDVLGLAQKIYG